MGRGAEFCAAVAPADAVFLDAKVERERLQSIGQNNPELNALARNAFRTLGLWTYLTAGPKEAHAWPIQPVTAAMVGSAGMVRNGRSGSDYPVGYPPAYDR